MLTTKAIGSAEVRLPGVIASPNIWNDPATYELENLGVDPDGAIEAAMRRVRDWAGQVVLDFAAAKCRSGLAKGDIA